MDRLAVRKRHYSQVSSQFSNIAPPSDAPIRLDLDVLWGSQHGLYPGRPEVWSAAKHDLLEVPCHLHPGRFPQDGPHLVIKFSPRMAKETGGSLALTPGREIFIAMSLPPGSGLEVIGPARPAPSSPDLVPTAD
jgi:hypothetical protein